MRRLPGLAPNPVTSVKVAAAAWWGSAAVKAAHNTAVQTPATHAVSRFIRPPLLGA
ncbi:hypothetical protein [Nonomuraea turcica]|uniref:hypothetical protein n=1 Tax=Nonomuraea sp. G32 TaxID=3067274 RepID=UPI00273B97BC|nr:hypothetical protein [Nonomuraea sp. G32]MDP4501840.1 hypothetical protein [Nonomuraea sp. G32]